MKNNILNQKLHRKGNTVSVTVLALLSVGSLANKSANADSFMKYADTHVSVNGLQNGYCADKIN